MLITDAAVKLGSYQCVKTAKCGASEPATDDNAATATDDLKGFGCSVYLWATGTDITARGQLRYARCSLVLDMNAYSCPPAALCMPNLLKFNADVDSYSYTKCISLLLISITRRSTVTSTVCASRLCAVVVLCYAGRTRCMGCCCEYL